MEENEVEQWRRTKQSSGGGQGKAVEEKEDRAVEEDEAEQWRRTRQSSGGGRSRAVEEDKAKQ